MRRKQLWIIIAALCLLNCLTVALYLSKGSDQDGFSEEDIVAKVGKSDISRQEWLHELETRYGRDVLRDMIDLKVITELAKKYKITISDDDIDREYRLLLANFSSLTEIRTTSEEKWEEQIRNSLLQEEILTRDVEISKADLKSYYEKNQQLFDVPTSYHLSHIIVKSRTEAERSIEELMDGSSFAALAMERSLDEYSANEGGDIGYVMEGDARFPSEYSKAAKKLKVGAWSEPIKVDKGYAVVQLNEKAEGKQYIFDEVKQQIRRQLALEQMKTSVSTDSLWQELGVEWFCGRTKTN